MRPTGRASRLSSSRSKRARPRRNTPERRKDMATIRPATASDAPELTVIARAAKRHWGYPEAWLAAWEPVLTIPPGHVGRNTVLVAERAERDGGVVSFVGLVDAGTHWELDHLWVLP